MFLTSLESYQWDLAIVLLLCASCGVAFACARAIRRQRGLIGMMAISGIGMLSALGFLTVLYGSFIEPQLLIVTRLSVPLSTNRPLTIAVISDLHVGPYKGRAYVSRVVKRINELMPDMVFIAGDFVLSDTIDADVLAPLDPLREIRSVYGTFAVLGNHDHGIFRRMAGAKPVPDRSDLVNDKLTNMGITVLKNEGVRLNLGTESILVSGIEDAWSGKADLVSALALGEKNAPTILLSHNPDVILDPLSSKAQLVIAGHTHGGQLRLPWIGALSALPTKLGRKYDQGVFPLGNDRSLAITHGVGESGPRARLFCPPEILLLTTHPTGPST